jgi:ectoine hydroxylase
VIPLIKRDADIVAATGRAGDVLMFHGNSVHGSAGNITPLSRRILYVTYNAVSNRLVKPTRAPFIAHRTFDRVEATEGSFLHETA